MALIPQRDLRSLLDTGWPSLKLPLPALPAFTSRFSLDDFFERWHDALARLPSGRAAPPAGAPGPTSDRRAAKGRRHGLPDPGRAARGLGELDAQVPGSLQAVLAGVKGSGAGRWSSSPREGPDAAGLVSRPGPGQLAASPGLRDRPPLAVPGRSGLFRFPGCRGPRQGGKVGWIWPCAAATWRETGCSGCATRARRRSS